MNKQERAIISNVESYLIEIAAKLSRIAVALEERNKIEAEKE